MTALDEADGEERPRMPAALNGGDGVERSVRYGVEAKHAQSGRRQAPKNSSPMPQPQMIGSFANRGCLVACRTNCEHRCAGVAGQLLVCALRSQHKSSLRVLPSLGIGIPSIKV